MNVRNEEEATNSFENDQDPQRKETVKESEIKSKSKSPKSNLPGAKRMRIDRIMRELDTKFIQDIKSTDKMNLKDKQIFNEIERLQKENKVGHKNKLRDEVILEMEKKNQDIEHKLKELKNKDKSELEHEEKRCKETWENINNFFNAKREEALKKDEIRKADLEEIKKIKQNQQKVQEEIAELEERKKKLQKECEDLDKDVKDSEYYKNFIDEVIKDNDEFSDFDKLKEKFENLMRTMTQINENIQTQKELIKETQEKQKNLKNKNDKFLQNQRLLQLEEEIKKYLNENKVLERDIDELMREKQKKESDNHQIILSILNLHDKVLESQKKNNVMKIELDEEKLCGKLDEIHSRINDS